MSVDVGTPLSLDVSQPLAALDKIGAADEALRRQQLQSNALVTQSFATVAASVQQYEGKLGAIVTESQAGAAAQRQFASEIAGLVKEIRDQAAAQREAQQASAAAAAERRKANVEARAAAKVEKDAAKEAAAAAKEVAAAERLRAKEAAAANAETGKGGGVLGKLGGFLGSLQGQVVAAFSVAAIKAFFSEVQENALNTEATISKLTFSNGGNAQAAARDLAFIRFEADRLGLDLNSAGKSYGSFTAAASAANYPLAEARKLFLATAGASTTLKLSADDTQGVLLALTQILSKGTVAAEELRGQIGERLPGAFSIAARAMGVTEQQLNKLLQTGQIKSIDFLPKFAAELQKTFGDGTAQAFDSAIANQNRFENEYNAFLLRFQGATAAATSKAAEYFKRFNQGLDLRTDAGRDRLASKAAQQPLLDYQAQVAAIVKQAEDEAKKAGSDVAFGVNYALAQQRNVIEQQLAAAREEVKKFDPSNPANTNFLANYPGGAEAYREADVLARKRVFLLEGEIAKLGEVAEARKKADMPTDLEGLVKRQQDIIKALKVRQLAATQENKGTGDYLLGTGGLDEQLKAAEKELDRLLGKVDKAAKVAADRLAAALRALEAARADLATKAAQAAIKDSDDATQRARLAYEEQLRQIELVKQKLIEREAAVKKAGGRGSNADGVIDGVQAQQLATLQAAASEQLTRELARIERERQALLLSLRQDSDQKELDQLEATFNEQVRLHEQEAGVLLALEAKYERDRETLLRTQATRRAQQQQQLGSTQASATAEVYGTGTGQSIFEAQRFARQQQLDADRTFAEQQLTILKDSKEKGADVERAALAAQLLRIRNQQIELNKEQKLSNFSIYKLILGENDNEKTRAALDQVVGSVVDSLNTIVSAEEQAAAQRASIASQNVSDLSQQLAAQIQLNQQGSASNIKALLDQIAAEKAARREALADQRAAAKEKLLIDTITQASSVATSVANVLAEFAFPYNLIAAAALVGGFIITKEQAFEAANKTPDGYYVGGYTGEGDPKQESRAVGPRPYTYHKAEFVMDHGLTDQYRFPLFEPLHRGRPEDIDWSHPSMQALLPDLALPEQMAADKRAYVEHRLQMSTAPMQAEFGRMHDRLAAIEKSNDRMANRPDRVPLGDRRYLEVSENGSTDVKNV